MANFYVITIITVLIYLYHVHRTTADFKSFDINNHLGTRTPYRLKYNKNDSEVIFQGCVDSKIWMLIRHGTRLPKEKDILDMKMTLTNLRNEIIRQHELGKGKLDKKQIEEFKEWFTDVHEENEKYLTQEGQDEMVQLASRMHKRFPNTIKKNYSSKMFLFRSTPTQRAQQSAKYFTIGLFGKENQNEVKFAPVSKGDPILRSYKLCDRWQKQVKKNPKTFAEQKLFGISKVMNESLISVSKRLGLDTVPSLDTVGLMYKTCGYETAWNKNKMSPWCYVFDADTAQNLEYYEDLKHYWQDGYGYNLTHRQACLPIKNMFDTFNNEEGPNATFLFSHSGTILKILSHLQLYKDAIPLRANPLEKDRAWKTSNIDCFAANIAFVMLKCEDGVRVLTLHQERTVKLPMCEEELCPLDHLTRSFHNSIHNCDFDEICSLRKTEL